MPTQDISIRSEETLVLFENKSHPPTEPRPSKEEAKEIGKTIVISCRHSNEGERKSPGEEEKGGGDKIDGDEAKEETVIIESTDEEKLIEMNVEDRRVTEESKGDSVISNTSSDTPITGGCTDTKVIAKKLSTAIIQGEDRDGETSTATNSNDNEDNDVYIVGGTAAVNQEGISPIITSPPPVLPEKEEEVERNMAEAERRVEEGLINDEDNGTKDIANVKEAWVNQVELRPQVPKPHPLTSRENIVHNEDKSVGKDRSSIVSPNNKEEGAERKTALFDKVLEDREEKNVEVNEIYSTCIKQAIAMYIVHVQMNRH